jgi:hypothetical protein
LLGGSPKAGNSYSAELCGILAACRSLPLNCPLHIYTDSLGSITVLEGPEPSLTQRFRIGSRALVMTVRRYIALRLSFGGVTKFTHVYSHTERPDAPSRGNAAADIVADSAATNSSFDVARATPFLTNEEVVVFWRPPDELGGRP